MRTLAAILLLAALWSGAAAGVEDFQSLAEKAVRDYYASLLDGRTLRWELEFRRLNAPKGRHWTITGVRGEAGERIPRGSRLCWLDGEVDGRERSIPVTVFISTSERLPFAAVDINPRTVIADSMIEWREVECASLGAALVLDSSKFGLVWAKTRIPAGTVVEHSRLAEAPEVRIGEDVTILARVGAVEIRAPGRALQDGGCGERIPVLSLSTNRRIYGKVGMNKTVVIKR